MPTLADLRYAFYGAGGDESVSDAEYRQLLALYEKGITLEGLASQGSAPIDLNNPPVGTTVTGTFTTPGNASSGTLWVPHLFTSDAQAPASVLEYWRGRLRSRIVGGTQSQQDRREAWEIPGLPSCEFSEIRTRIATRRPTAGTVQHPHFHRLQTGDDGKIRAAVFWDFGVGTPLGGVWEADPDGSDFVAAQARNKYQDLVTASARDGSGVVTLTVAAGATSRWEIGDPIVVDLTDNTFDKASIITGVTNTTITYVQTNGGADADGGTGTVTLLGRAGPDGAADVTSTRAIALTDAVRTNGIVVGTHAAGHSFQRGDYITVDLADATYDGQFVVTDVNALTAVVSWAQPGVANDASGGAGTIQKAYPHIMKSRLLPGNILQGMLFPDMGMAAGGANVGPLAMADPPWESRWAVTYDLSTITGATAPTGEGKIAVGGAHHWETQPVQIDNLTARPLYF